MSYKWGLFVLDSCTHAVIVNKMPNAGDTIFAKKMFYAVLSSVDLLKKRRFVLS